MEAVHPPIYGLVTSITAPYILTLAAALTANRTATFPNLAINVAGSAATLTANRIPSATGTLAILQDSRIIDGVTAGKLLTLAATDNFTLTVPATGTAALTGIAQAVTFGTLGFTTLTASGTGNVIDYGTGALPALITANTVLRVAGADAVANSLEYISFGGSCYIHRGRSIGGTRASPAATANGNSFFNLAGLGHDGVAYVNSTRVQYNMRTCNLWTATDNATEHIWSGTPLASTTFAEWMRLRDSALLIGITARAGTELLNVNGSAIFGGVSCTTLTASGLVTGTGTYGQIYIDTGATAFNVATGTTYVLCTAFNAATGYDGLYSDCTLAKASNKITITRAGKYRVTFHLSFTSDKNTTNYRAAIFNGGVECGNVHDATYSASGANIQSMDASGFITVAANADIDFRMRHDNGDTVAITPVYSSIQIMRVGA